MIKVAGTLGKSTEVMKEVSSLMKVPEIQQQMMEMSKGGMPESALGHPPRAMVSPHFHCFSSLHSLAPGFECRNDEGGFD
jgi:hypothetical protein